MGNFNILTLGREVWKGIGLIIMSATKNNFFIIK